MNDTTEAATAMRRAGRRAAMSATVTLAIAATLIGLLVPWVSDLVLFGRATYAEVTVVAVDERVVTQRARLTTSTVRQVEVALPDGSADFVESRNIEVGDTVVVWQQSETGELFETEPARPGFSDWAWASATALLSVMLLLGFVGGLRKALALFRADLEHAARVQLRVTETGAPTTSGGSRRQPRVPLVADVVASDHPRTPAGETVRFTLPVTRLQHGTIAPVSAYLDARVVHQGAMQTVLAVRSDTQPTWAVITI